MIKYETNSKLVQKGQIFIAIKGHTVDGHNYIKEAINNGAIKVICEKEIEEDIPHEIVKDTKIYLKDILVKEYSNEINKLKIIGVTGTNGKTTSCYLMYQMLQKLGKKAAYLGTLGFYLNDEITETDNTTPDILTLYKLLLKATESNIEYLVMEVSSHSLSYERIKGLTFVAGAFTNLTEDHLDYHKTMENYLKAKKLILNYIKEDGVMISNIDDPYGIEFKYNNFKTLGFNNSDYQILDYSYTNLTTKIHFKYDKEYYVETNLLNKFNIYNYITALCLVNNLGIGIEDIIRVTKNIYAPNGRNEIISIKEGKAIIDYAHTPDAVEKIITSNLENKIGKVITIVGCGGDRDPKKRPIMGNIATKLSDFVIFTNDNPRTEDEKNIMNDILSGVDKDNYIVIYDRREAIKKGVSMIEKNDTLLILGKGHEDYQIIGHEKHHLSDKEEVLKYIN